MTTKVLGAEAVRRRGVFYGWWIVLIVGVLQLVSNGTAISAVGVFFAPLEKEFGWNRAQVSLAVSVIFTVGGLAGPALGRFCDLYGTRLVIAAGAVLALAGFGLLHFVTTLWQFYLGYAVMALGRAGMGWITLNILVANWFYRRRSVALGLTSVGSGLAALVIAPLASFLVLGVGWRSTYLLLGLLVFAAGVPAALFVVRNRPADLNLAPDGEPVSPLPDDGTALSPRARQTRVLPSAVGEPAWTVGLVLRSRAFWLLGALFPLTFVGQVALSVHLIPLLQDRGIAPQIAAAMVGVMAAFATLGRLLASFLIHRLHATGYIYAGCVFIQAAAVLTLLAGGSSMLLVWAFLVVYGLAAGGPPALEAPLVAECFGLRVLGTVLGLLGVTQMVGLMVGPVAAGLIFDLTGSYSVAFIVFALSSVLAGICAWLVKPGTLPQSRLAAAS